MATPRVMQPDDIFDNLRFLQGGELSPDGTLLAYSVSHVVKDDNEEFTTLYLLDVATGNVRQLTSGTRKDGKPAFSPDGSKIAFTSKREGDEKPQLYVMPVDGGEALKLGEVKQGVNGFKWSPDGSKIAFTAGVDYGDDEAPDHSKNPYRVTRNVWRFDAIGNLDLAVNNLYVMDVESTDVTQLTDDDTLISGFEWSPDGTQLLYGAMMRPDRFRGFENDVYITDLQGERTQLLPDWGMVGGMAWHPSGEKIVMIGNPNDDAPIGTHPNLWVYDVASGTMDNRSPSLERGIGGNLTGGRMPVPGLVNLCIAFSADGSKAITRVVDAGRTKIMSFALSGDEDVQTVVDGDRVANLQHQAGEWLLFAVDDIHNTPDLYIAHEDGSDERQLTHINDEFLSSLPMPEVVNLHFKGTDGADVEGWYAKPTDGSEGPFPTILWIHGGPHACFGNHFSFDTHMFNGAGYGVLFINHRASTGYGDEFSTAIKGDWGNLDYGDLMAGVDYAVEQGLADPDKLGCCGISGGGNLSSWIIGNTQRFKAAIPQNPVTNWNSFYGVSDIGVWFSTEQLGGHPHEIPDVYAKCSPITYAHTATTPTLIIQHEHDWRCPAEQSEQLYTVLKANGCTVEMLRMPLGAHGGSIVGPVQLRKEHLYARLHWFNKYVLGIAESEAELEAVAATD